MRKKTQQMAHTSIRLPRALARQVQQIARSRGHGSTSKVIREILQAYLIGGAYRPDDKVTR